MSRHDGNGFTLTELLIAMALGLMLCAAVLQALVGEERISRRLGRHWREKATQRRTLELLRGELLAADAVTPTPSAGAPACQLAGRTVVLHLALGQGRPPVTYTAGEAPSGIWRGRVLMRCGPAYGLDGRPGGGAAQNRVLLDGLPAEGGFTAEIDVATGVARLRLRQEFADQGVASPQRIESEVVATAH